LEYSDSSRRDGSGEGEDARIKSAIGIGSLLADGIGDTIRVSLTEDSIQEIPVAKALVAMTSAVVAGRVAGKGSSRHGCDTDKEVDLSFDPFSYQRRATETIAVTGIGDPGQTIKLGGEELIRVVVRQANFEKIGAR